METMVGYRFHPTDKEIIQHYLRNKISGNETLVRDVVKEINIHSFEPWDLPWILRKQLNDDVLYAFTVLERKCPGSGLTSRSTAVGFWKATGRDREIKVGGETIGFMKTLVFHCKASRRQKSPLRTAWVIHEYRVDSSIPNPRNLVLCKIKHKERKCRDAVSHGKGKQRSSQDPDTQICDRVNIATEVKNQSQRVQFHIDGGVSGFWARDCLLHDESNDPTGFNNKNVKQQSLRTPESSCGWGMFDYLENITPLSDDRKSINKHNANEQIQDLYFCHYGVFDDPAVDEFQNQTWLNSQFKESLGYDPQSDLPQDPFGNSNSQIMPHVTQQSECGLHLDGSQCLDQGHGRQPNADDAAWGSNVNYYSSTHSNSLSGIYVDSDSDTDDESIHAKSFRASSDQTVNDCHAKQSLVTPSRSSSADKNAEIIQPAAKLPNYNWRERQSNLSLMPSPRDKELLLPQTQKDGESEATTDLPPKFVTVMLGTQRGTASYFSGSTFRSVVGKRTFVSWETAELDLNPSAELDLNPSLSWFFYLILAGLCVSVWVKFLLAR